MLVHQKTMFDRSSLFLYNIIFCLKTLEKRYEKFNFCIDYNGSQKHEGFPVMECPKNSNQFKPYPILKMWSIFCICCTYSNVLQTSFDHVCKHCKGAV